MKEYEGILIPEVTAEDEENIRQKKEDLHFIFNLDMTGVKTALIGSLSKSEKNKYTENEFMEPILNMNYEDDSELLMDRAFSVNYKRYFDSLAQSSNPLRVKNADAYKEFQNEIKKYSNAIEKIIVSHTPDDAAGQKARDVVRATTTNKLNNILRGYSDTALSLKTPLGCCLSNFSACVETQMSDDILVNNINKHKEDFPIYDVVIESARLKDSLIDYYEAKDKSDGPLPPEQEKKHRQAIYENVLAMIEPYNKVIEECDKPEVNEMALNERIMDQHNAAVHLHPKSGRGTLSIKCGLETYKMGLENGWPLEDLPLITAFYMAALNEKYNAECNRADKLENFKQYDEPRYDSPKKKEAVEKMLSFYEELKTKKIQSPEDRKAAINQMTNMMYAFPGNNSVKEYYLGLDKERVAREKNIASGIEPAFYESAVAGNDIKFDEIIKRFNTKRTDKWKSNESTVHENLRIAMNDLAKFRKEHKVPGKEAGKEAIEKYYSEYLGKLDKVQHFTDIYIDKRRGASSKGGMERLKGAADMSNFIDLEKKMIQRELVKTDMNYTGKTIDQIRIGFAGSQLMNSASELSGMAEMPNDIESYDKMNSLAADIMLGRIVANGKNRSGSKVLSDLGAEMMKKEIMNSAEFKKMMADYMADVTMTPSKLVNELSGDKAIRKIKSYSSSLESAGKSVDKKAEAKRKMTAKRDAKVDKLNKADKQKREKNKAFADKVSAQAVAKKTVQKGK